MASTGDQLFEVVVDSLKKRFTDPPQEINPDPGLRDELLRIEGEIQNIIQKSGVGQKLRSMPECSGPCKHIRRVLCGSPDPVSIPNTTTGTCDWVLVVPIK